MCSKLLDKATTWSLSFQTDHISQLKCLVSGIEKSDCSVTDQTCICTDPSLNLNVDTCVKLSCTIRESLSKCWQLILFQLLTDEFFPATKNVTATACHAPVRDRTAVVSVVGMAGMAVAILAFILRICARFRCCGGHFGWDDGTMVFTMVCSWVFRLGICHNH